MHSRRRSAAGCLRSHLHFLSSQRPPKVRLPRTALRDIDPLNARMRELPSRIRAFSWGSQAKRSLSRLIPNERRLFQRTDRRERASGPCSQSLPDESASGTLPTAKPSTQRAALMNGLNRSARGLHSTGRSGPTQKCLCPGPFVNSAWVLRLFWDAA